MRVPLDIPPGLFTDDTTYAAAGRWADGSNVRFNEGRPETIGGWEGLSGDMLGGVCRSAFSWSDNNAVLNIGFGTHATLEVWQGGSYFNITPTLAKPPVKLGVDPLAVSNGSPTVTVTHTAHGYVTGASIIVSGATAVGGIMPNGTFTITVATANTYTYTFGSNASSTASGGGSAVVIAPQEAFAAGSIDGTGGAGYGTGTYSTGDYSEPSIVDYFPRTWSQAAWGENLAASPRNGTIYLWQNDTGTRAAPVQNAPARATYMLIAPQQQIFALGCNEEVSGRFNPLCIRHSGVRRETVWNTANDTTAREYVLPGGGWIVGGLVLASYLLVWTSHGLFLGTYVGSVGQPWRFDQVGTKCGLIGPNAAVVVGQRAFWIGPDLQFYTYTLGGAASALPCSIRNDFANNLAASQGDKIMASSIASFSEVRWDYPDARDGVENSRYVALKVEGLGAGAWYRGQMVRTAMLDAGPTTDPVGVDFSGAAYWHERGHSADGAPFAWRIKTADQYVSEDTTMLVRGIWPDLADQLGAVNVTLHSRFKPQSDVSSRGPYPLAPGEDKADFKAKGRLFGVEFSGESAPTFARLGRPVFDVVAGGRR